MKKIFIALLLTLQGSSVLACSVCFSTVKDDPQMIAMRNAILTLMFILLFILVLFTIFIIKVVRKQKLLLGKENGL